jgi:hypothetical protein
VTPLETLAGMINVYIDNNIWDFLFERRIDLCVELSGDEFCLLLTHEAEFEFPLIPKKKAFIESTIARCGIRTDRYFGFHDDSLPLSEQRIGGAVLRVTRNCVSLQNSRSRPTRNARRNCMRKRLTSR